MKKYKLLILIILCISIILVVSIPNKSVDKYLKRNHSDLNLADEHDFSGLEILSKDIKDKKIILAGELHNLAENHIVELKLLKYLQKEIGVNYYLAEVGYADAYFLNKYLESGDETVLKNYFNIYKNQKYYTEEQYNFYTNMYKHNQTLPKEKQIKVIGVDIESKVTYDYILDVIKDKENITNELKVLMNKLKEFNYNSRESYKNILKVLNNLTEDIKLNEEKYKNIFKKDFEEFKLVLKNLKDFSTACTGNIIYDNVRDKYIYENFKVIDSKLENAVYFGQWGYFHVFQDTFYSNIDMSDMNYFSSLLNKDEKYRGKILSINYGYYFEEPQLGHGYSYIDENLFKDYLNSDSKATIFSLNNRKSPFKEKTINPFSTNAVDYKNNPTTKYFQYLILIRNSEKSKIVM